MGLESVILELVGRFYAKHTYLGIFRAQVVLGTWVQKALQGLTEEEREVSFIPAWTLKPKVSGSQAQITLYLEGAYCIILSMTRASWERKVWACGDVKGLRKETWDYGKSSRFWSRRKQKSTLYNEPTQSLELIS